MVLFGLQVRLLLKQSLQLLLVLLLLLSVVLLVLLLLRATHLFYNRIDVTDCAQQQVSDFLHCVAACYTCTSNLTHTVTAVTATETFTLCPKSWLLKLVTYYS
jgi:hypothetical protein